MVSESWAKIANNENIAVSDNKTTTVKLTPIVSDNKTIDPEDQLYFNEVYGDKIESEIFNKYQDLKDRCYILRNTNAKYLENFFMSFVDILTNIEGNDSEEYSTSGSDGELV